MKHPYDKVYLDDVRERLGYMCQYAVSIYDIPLSELLNTFKTSKLAWGIERSLPHYMVGKVGKEMLQYLYPDLADTKEEVGYGVEFWIGWAMAFLQWYSGLTFKELLDIVDVNRFYKMYPAYHEMDDYHLKVFSKKYLRKTKFK